MIQKFVFALLFCFAGQASACTAETAPEQAPESPKSSLPATTGHVEYLRLMPENTSFVFYANLQEMKQSSVGEEFRLEFEKKFRDEEDEDYEEFVRETGMDPKKDIVEAWVGGFAVAKDDNVAGAIVRGRFDEKRIVSYAREKKSHRYEEVVYKGHKIYRFGKDDEQMTFLDANSVVVGDRRWLEVIIDQAESGGKNVQDNDIMSSYMSEVAHKEHLWGVVDLSGFSADWAGELRRNSAFQGTQSLENLKSIVFYSHFDEKTDLYMRGNFTTSEEAETVAEMVSGFKAMAKLMVSDDREAVDMLNDIKIDTDGAVMEVKTQFDKTFWHKFKEKRKRFSDGPVKML